MALKKDKPILTFSKDISDFNDYKKAFNLLKWLLMAWGNCSAGNSTC